jgi:intracellular septation protein A
MRISRRAVFFMVVTVMCLLLAPVCPAEFRWVNYAMAGLAAFWALMMTIDGLTSRGPGERGAGL